MYHSVALTITVILTGFIVGVFSRAILFGERKRGFLFTAALGVAACFIGDKVAQQYLMTSPLFAKDLMFERGFEYILYLTTAILIGAIILFIWDRLV
ncbi:MAG: hypothetical protein K2P98_01135 [Neisseriaceae bacterium]|nr:hypothetical protein [Neisseriaceae bacterium]